MSDLISRISLKQSIALSAILKDKKTLEQIIDEEPSIDAVPVIRCKDCKWWTKQEDSLQGRCALHGMYPTGEWFCANARREEE